MHKCPSNFFMQLRVTNIARPIYFGVCAEILIEYDVGAVNGAGLAGPHPLLNLWGRIWFFPPIIDLGYEKNRRVGNGAVCISVCDRSRLGRWTRSELGLGLGPGREARLRKRCLEGGRSSYFRAFPPQYFRRHLSTHRVYFLHLFSPIFVCIDATFAFHLKQTAIFDCWSLIWAYQGGHFSNISPHLVDYTRTTLR